MTHDAITALFREIGIAETVRFLHQFTLGRGDSTRERNELLGNPSLDQVLDAIRQQRQPSGSEA
ncbi:MAG TPA: hypothetical protein VLF66_19395, partial [Thermoanaerobaculia bacterium]|nr:hypothetical protein [Thermoanaerobaculia bacterium]